MEQAKRETLNFARLTVRPKSDWKIGFPRKTAHSDHSLFPKEKRTKNCPTTPYTPHWGKMQHSHNVNGTLRDFIKGVAFWSFGKTRRTH